MKKLLPGDIILTSSKSFMSKAIKFMLWKINDPAPYSHIAGCVSAKKVIEAVFSGVTLNSFEKLISNKNAFMIIRMKKLTYGTRRKIAEMAIEREGTSYGFVKVMFLQALDQITFTNFFTKHFSITEKVYCSQLWAQIYFDALKYKINGVNPKSCEPDDWQDEVIKNPDKWEIIYERKELC